MQYMPIVTPEEVPSFEEFAYNYYAQHPELYPSNAGISDFGKGIYIKSSESPYPDKRIHDTIGQLDPFNRSILTPTVQLVSSVFSDTYLHKFLLMNMRGEMELCKKAQDQIIECVAKYYNTSSNGSNSSSATESCTVITTIHEFPGYEEFLFAMLLTPITLAQNPGEVVGFITSSLQYADIIEKKLSPEVDDIEFVLQTDDIILTYTIINGKPHFKGLGDVHDSHRSRYARQSNVLEGLQHEILTDMSKFTVTFYPTCDYEAKFNSNFRWIFCFGSVIIITFVTIVFIAYDYSITRFTNEQKNILEMKRQFVRFISHEVRTPLNAVSMAGDLLHDQVNISRYLRYIYIYLLCIVYYNFLFLYYFYILDKSFSGKIPRRCKLVTIIE